MKNPTPKQIVLRSAIIVSIVFLILELLRHAIKPLDSFWYTTLLSSVIIFTVSYLVYYRLLETFIYRKIKLIYKNIHDSKSTKYQTDQTVDLDKDIISEVNDQVVKWANERNTEIDQLKRMEIYRKEFLGNVSHELKTPITSIQGYLETLADGGLYDPNIAVDYLQKAVRNVERMTSIIENLESIAHLESGEFALRYTPFDINELTKDVFIDVELHGRQRNITMSIKEGCDKIFLVYADKQLIKDVLVNLIMNSIKYGREGGRTFVGFY
ncbi:MAG: sensor histidine kinase, partial [Sediminibacterium sp.]